MWLFGVWMVSQPAEAQFSGAAVYELGFATTDVGEDQGNASLAYGFGAGVTYSFFSANSVGLVVGADLLVRSFGVDLPDRIQRDVGVFDQTDLIFDQLVALRFRRILAGLYLEQRRIDRGTALGTLGFPASAVGLVVDAPLGSGDRTGVRFSYAWFRSGRLRLQGSADRTGGRLGTVDTCFRKTLLFEPLGFSGRVRRRRIAAGRHPSHFYFFRSSAEGGNLWRPPVFLGT